MARTKQTIRTSKKQLAAKAVKTGKTTGIVNPGSDSTSKEDKSHSSDCPRPLLWRPWLAKSPLAIYGQCFKITKPSSRTSVSCSTSCSFHKNKSIKKCLRNVGLGQTVQVIRCKDQCYNELNLVAVALLHNNGQVHLPVDCIDVNKPLKYKCFLCDTSDLSSDFEKAKLHLIECHPKERWPGWLVPGTKFKSNGYDMAYTRRLKRLLLGQQHRADLVKLRQKTGEESERFQGQLLRQKMHEEKNRFKTQLKLAQKDSDEKSAQIEALKSELQKACSSSPADITMIIEEEHAGDKDEKSRN
jgi:hypothetical protein